MRYVYILFMLLGSLCVNAAMPKTITAIDEDGEQHVYLFKYSVSGLSFTGFSVNGLNISWTNNRDYTIKDKYTELSCILNRKTGVYTTNYLGILENYELGHLATNIRHIDRYYKEHCTYQTAEDNDRSHPIVIEGTRDVYNDNKELIYVNYHDIKYEYTDYYYQPYLFDCFGFIVSKLIPSNDLGHIFDLWYVDNVYLDRLPSKIESVNRTSHRGNFSYRGEHKSKSTYKFYDYKFKSGEIQSFKIRCKTFIDKTYTIYIDYYD